MSSVVGSSAHNKLTVVVIGEPLYSCALKELLERHSTDIGVVATSTRAEMQQALRGYRADLVLVAESSLDPARVTGEVLAEMQEDDQERKVIVLGKASATNVLEALHAGARGYATPELGIDDLVRMLLLLLRDYAIFPSNLVKEVLAARSTSRVDNLSGTEWDLLRGIARGEPNKKLAHRLHMSERTIRRRLHNLYGKLGVEGRFHAAMYVMEMNERGSELVE